MAFEAGSFVRLKNDPGRTGTLTGRARARGERKYYQVRFAEGESYVAEYELECVNTGQEDVYDLLARSRYGSLNDLRRNLTHIQLTGKLANLVYSMDTTNTDFYAYQFKSVLSFLESPSNGLLIADEVGLGKTIEAGLIWTEIRARYDARRLLVVCPAMLREKWKSELETRFSIHADIVDAAGLLTELNRNKGAVPDGRALICSMQSIRPPKDWHDNSNDSPAARLATYLDEASEDDPLIDMVIIDESHYMRNPGTQTAALGRLLRGATDYMVLLSATPVNLKEDDLFYQLALVDPDFFTRPESFPEVLSANEPLIKAREFALDTHAEAADILACLKEASQHEVLADNGQLAALCNGGIDDDTMATTEGRIRLANRIERINLLSHAVTRTRKRDVHELRVIREPHAYFVEMNLAEREVYEMVTDAILNFAQKSDISSGFLLAGPQRRVSSCVYAAVKSWKTDDRTDKHDLYEDFGVDDGVVDRNEGEERPLRRRLMEEVAPNVDLAVLREHDSKYETFRGLVLEYLREHPEEKMVVFSYYPGTLEYLRERLSEDGVESAILHGSVRLSKDEVIAQFRDDQKLRVLLSSEVASEGVDLQFCRVLVNYDLPWNPMKVEQRIGRIDRLGQESEMVSILNLGHVNTIDHRIYQRLMVRLGIFESALGGMEAILGEYIHDLTSDLFSHPLTPEQQEARIEQTARAVEQIKQQQDALEKKASHMIAHGGYILEQVQAAHDFKKRITSEDLKVYVKDYLDRYSQGHTFQQINDKLMDFDIRLSTGLLPSFDQFIQRNKLQGQTSLAGGDTIRCHFRNKMAPPKRFEETINQFHPLIRFISDDLRKREEAYYPLVAVAVPSTEASGNIRPGIYSFAVQRWSFSGLKQEEQLQARAISLADDEMLGADESFNLVNSARVTGHDWLSAGNELDSNQVTETIDRCIESMKDDLNLVVQEKKLSNNDRVNFQLNAAARHRDRQLKTQQEVLMRYKASGKHRMIPAVEGKIRKIKDRFAVKEAQLQEKLQFRHGDFDVCCGVIQVLET